jgi:hypothetical protein
MYVSAKKVKLRKDGGKPKAAETNEFSDIEDTEAEEIQCPRMLRELLMMPEVVSLLGEDCHFLLRLLIGPPSGLNLRNITWHGFVSISEFSPSYVSLLFVMLMSLPVYISTHPDMAFSKRQQRNLMKVSPSVYDFGLGECVLPGM